MLDVLSFVFATVIGIVGLIYSHLSYKQNQSQINAVTQNFTNHINHSSIQQSGNNNSIISVQRINNCQAEMQLNNLLDEIEMKHMEKKQKYFTNLLHVGGAICIVLLIFMGIINKDINNAVSTLLNPIIIACVILNLLILVRIIVVDKPKNHLTLILNILAFFSSVGLAGYVICLKNTVANSPLTSLVAFVFLCISFSVNFAYCFCSPDKEKTLCFFFQVLPAIGTVIFLNFKFLITLAV